MVLIMQKAKTGSAVRQCLSVLKLPWVVCIGCRETQPGPDILDNLAEKEMGSERNNAGQFIGRHHGDWILW